MRVSSPVKVLFLIALATFSRVSPALSQETVDSDISFDWDLISLEQNNIRFNGSVLSGFHSIRSPGVTPARAWKTGLGVLYSREELTASSAGTTRTFDNDRLILNPKINYGLLDWLELGAGVEVNFANGSEVQSSPTGVQKDSQTELNISAAVGGIKWNFFRSRRLRLAASFDARAALNTDEFGMLEASIFNFELDGDFELTPRFSMISNLQLLTSDRNVVEHEVVFDVAGTYAFSDRFRGMLFTTLKEDDEANDVVFFFGLAGQYVYEVHSFTFAVDFQLNDARREVRTDNQIDLEFSYTFTFD